MIKTVEQIKEEVDITYAQIERRPEKRKKREKKKFLHFLKIPLTKKELCIYYSLLLRLITIVHVAAAVGKNWILSPPSPCFIHFLMFVLYLLIMRSMVKFMIKKK